MTTFVKSPVPEIFISFAPPEVPAEEPYSPFAILNPVATREEESYRPTLLSPPPVAAPKFHRQLSPLRPADAPVASKGLERERFEAMLKASKERNSAVGAKKALDLRKEIALKAHKSKQIERRAIFLSKLTAPPSASAISEPKTPPESPSIFNYTLPSPGLESPLAMFDSAPEDPARPKPCAPWVEQVEYRMPQKKEATPVQSKRKSLPSLEEITARLSSQAPIARPDVVGPCRSPIPLPAFLKTGARAHRDAPPPIIITPPEAPQARRLPLSVGRLRLPSRTPSPPSPQQLPSSLPMTTAPPKSPGAPPSPKIQIKTTVVPRTSSAAPSELTESNLVTFNARSRTANDMLSALRRRTFYCEGTSVGRHADQVKVDEKTKLERRHSSPAEFMKRERSGFTHPVLDMPGGF
ncbi:hypothetical protein JAAARDRAFT_189360 [Jaapia argillacea MUCL 33604]|uniref:Uncharacterized protein n=1 Tax=Jaapia argillacea MUCL 33604 TaxID=933084 RepID=A0A067QCF0_9AGAM|nr:hypothetical protein JAAARDRAFT_189360 [Jaapia argillacea MUCL 33604]